MSLYHRHQGSHGAADIRILECVCLPHVGHERVDNDQIGLGLL